MLKALLQSHNFAKRSSRIRKQQHLSCAAEQLKTVLRCGPFFKASVLQDGTYATGESETVQSVLIHAGGSGLKLVNGMDLIYY